MMLFPTWLPLTAPIACFILNGVCFILSLQDEEDLCKDSFVA